MLMITGATGALGKLVTARLADREDVVIGTRSPAPGERRVDFDDPASLDFTGVDTLLVISAGAAEDDVVIARHDAAISAAEKAGVRHLVYTSLSGDGDHLTYALAHRWTERRLRASSLRWTVLRNGLYAEFLAAIAAPGPDGTIAAPLGTGRLAAVAREDLAEAAVRVATAPAAHAGRTYELVGEHALGGADLAAALGGSYEPGSLAATRAALIGAGQALPFQVPMLMSTYSAVAGGFLDGTSIERNDLRTLLGREPRPAIEAYVRAVRG
ncbi:NmrA family transcriptional regulator [Streptomyces sp. WAC 01529]|uniref:NAD(P)H-binding protein n=1 Tax=Streptomyces sp. WAC 01529 TaxID=2203205 RepID=UPI000F6C9AF8|nr:NAD(P)H-binding protein [Streptomyces sp. WAC 01529]AZM51365.1 NmrA family transcriptional regulator [Streptomyces sp. WAC 01529]